MFGSLFRCRVFLFEEGGGGRVPQAWTMESDFFILIKFKYHYRCQRLPAHFHLTVVSLHRCISTVRVRDLIANLPSLVQEIPKIHQIEVLTFDLAGTVRR